jgi:hypothetical protein
MVMPNEITHQDIQHKVIDENGLTETWHGEPKPSRYTDKRTAISCWEGSSFLDGRRVYLVRWEHHDQTG